LAPGHDAHLNGWLARTAPWPPERRSGGVQRRRPILRVTADATIVTTRRIGYRLE
jgi:hypothetical protein